MKILLKKEVEKLGNIGDVVDVANGYARNYLLPKKLATVVTKGNIEQINLQILKNEEKRKDEIKNLQVLADEISNISYTITVKTNKEGKLFGSVTASDIAKHVAIGLAQELHNAYPSFGSAPVPSRRSAVKSVRPGREQR